MAMARRMLNYYVATFLLLADIVRRRIRMNEIIHRSRNEDPFSCLSSNQNKCNPFPAWPARFCSACMHEPPFLHFCTCTCLEPIKLGFQYSTCVLIRPVGRRVK